MALTQQTSATSQQFTSSSTVYTQDRVSKPAQVMNAASPSSAAEAAGTSTFTPEGTSSPCSPLPRNASQRQHEPFAPC